MRGICFYRLVAATLAAGSFSAVAALPDGPYAGAGLGMPHFQDNVNGVSVNGAGLSGKLYGGYQFSSHFALEAGAADLGRAGNRSGNLDAHGVYIDALGIVPVYEKWSLLGRVGVTRVNLNTSNGSSGGNGLKVGAGAQYDLTIRVALRGEWERYHPSAFDGNPNIDQVTFGLRIAF